MRITWKEYLKYTEAQWRGTKARTTAKIETRAGAYVPPGTVVTILGKAGGFEIDAPVCSHCGMGFYCRKVDPSSLELLEASPALKAVR
jgi:hypothetical protein